MIIKTPKSILVLIFGLLTTLCFSQDKAKGHYWDLNGVKHEGKLKMDFSSRVGRGTQIKFYGKGEKPKRLDKTIVESFIWDIDSFALITNFDSSPFFNHESDFAKVVSNGKINLYRHWIKKHSDGIATTPVRFLASTYIVQLSFEGAYIGIYNKKRFEEYILPVIKSNKALYDKVMAMPKKEWLRKISSIIKEYNE